MAQTFMDTLQEAERSGDVTPLVALFADDAELERLSQQAHRGQEGAKTFWEEYLAMFQEIRSDFFHTITGDEGVLLEWESTGKLPNGKPVTYRGVSVLEPQGDKVRRFRTYYDSAVFVPEGAKTQSKT